MTYPSYPYLQVAKETGKPYAEVLKIQAQLEQRPSNLIWNDCPCLYCQTSNAMIKEMERRELVMAIDKGFPTTADAWVG